MTRFINAYEKDCPGFTLNYTSSGSGAGVSEFLGGQTDFGGSDSPLNAEKGEVDKAKERCGGSEAWNLPAVFGPIAVTYNVDGVDGLVLDGPTLGKIFNGTVKTWNAPEIEALNEGATLPAEPINVIFRSDESGTTDNFQKYLDAASDGSWGKGAGKSFAGGVGEGAKGNEGTSAAIKSTPGSITYNEWSFAKSQDLSIAKIITSAGPEPVELSTETAGKAIDGVKFKGEGNDLVLDTASFYMPTEAGSYPIMLGGLRDRVLEVPGCRGGHRGEGIPALGARQRPDRARGERLHPDARGVQDAADRRLSTPSTRRPSSTTAHGRDTRFDRCGLVGKADEPTAGRGYFREANQGSGRGRL